MLQLNGGQQVTVNGNGSFTFPNLELHGASYTVKVKTQTALQRELCTVSSGAAGNLSANVTNIKVSCAVVLGFVYVVDENRNVLEYGIQPQTARSCRSDPSRRSLAVPSTWWLRPIAVRFM